MSFSVLLSKVFFVVYTMSYLPTRVCESREVVEWFAPIHSGGGYCTEAISFGNSLMTVQNVSYDFRMTHHGDTRSEAYMQGRHRGGPYFNLIIDYL